MKTTEARKLLGVGRNASPHDIKKAFRHLAMCWHPDRNSAPEAHEMFARLSAAYDLLLEPFKQKTAYADHRGDAQADKTESRGADRSQDIELDIMQLCLGGTAEVILESSVDCAACAGQGKQEHTHSQLCGHCQGSGRVRHGKTLRRCEDCDGRGYTHRIRCPQCRGSGRQSYRRALAVTIPPGLLPGDELRLGGEGYAPPSGKGSHGDLRLRIQLRKHPLYALDGSDIVLERPVSFFFLLGGGKITVPTPAGSRELAIAPGPAAPREQTLPGAGLPARGKRPAGNLRVCLIPMLPTVATPDLAALCRALQTEIRQMEETIFPELAAWEHRWLGE